MIAEMIDRIKTLENIMNDESLLPRRSLQLKTLQLWGIVHSMQEAIVAGDS